MANQILVCHTDGCVNENVEIVLDTPATVVVCSPCGQEITDKKAA